MGGKLGPVAYETVRGSEPAEARPPASASRGVMGELVMLGPRLFARHPGRTRVE